MRSAGTAGASRPRPSGLPRGRVPTVRCSPAGRGAPRRWCRRSMAPVRCPDRTAPNARRRGRRGRASTARRCSRNRPEASPSRPPQSGAPLRRRRHETDSWHSPGVRPRRTPGASRGRTAPRRVPGRRSRRSASCRRRERSGRTGCAVHRRPRPLPNIPRRRRYGRPPSTHTRRGYGARSSPAALMKESVPRENAARGSRRPAPNAAHRASCTCAAGSRDSSS